ncbi:hypothetical protein B0H13DRAFT_2425547 [Mycena leptocephala]|nr:hypothetical protein B0H13DRAFT_2425547 [Mycena leptocephala]
MRMTPLAPKNSGALLADTDNKQPKLQMLPTPCHIPNSVIQFAHSVKLPPTPLVDLNPKPKPPPPPTPTLLRVDAIDDRDSDAGAVHVPTRAAIAGNGAKDVIHAPPIAILPEIALPELATRPSTDASPSAVGFKFQVNIKNLLLKSASATVHSNTRAERVPASSASTPGRSGLLDLHAGAKTRARAGVPRVRRPRLPRMRTRRVLSGLLDFHADANTRATYAPYAPTCPRAASTGNPARCASGRRAVCSTSTRTQTQTPPILPTPPTCLRAARVPSMTTPRDVHAQAGPAHTLRSPRPPRASKDKDKPKPKIKIKPKTRAHRARKPAHDLRRRVLSSLLDLHAPKSATHTRRSRDSRADGVPREPWPRPGPGPTRELEVIRKLSPARDSDSARLELESHADSEEAPVGALRGPPALGVEGAGAWVARVKALDATRENGLTQPQPQPARAQTQWWTHPRPNTAPSASYAALLADAFGPGSVLRGEGPKPGADEGKGGGASEASRRGSGSGSEVAGTRTGTPMAEFDIDVGMDVDGETEEDEVEMALELDSEGADAEDDDGSTPARAGAWITQIQVLLKGKRKMAREDLKALADTLQAIADLSVEEGRALGDDGPRLRQSLVQLAQLEEREIPFCDEFGREKERICGDRRTLSLLIRGCRKRAVLVWAGRRARDARSKMTRMHAQVTRGRLYFVPRPVRYSPNSSNAMASALAGVKSVVWWCESSRQQPYTA